MEFEPIDFGQVIEVPVLFTGTRICVLEHLMKPEDRRLRDRLLETEPPEILEKRFKVVYFDQAGRRVDPFGPSSCAGDAT